MDHEAAAAEAAALGRFNVRLHKYRAISPGDTPAIARLVRLAQCRVWCARPDTLNDPDEFNWTCDFRPSDATLELIAAIIEERKGRPPALARRIATSVIQGGRLPAIGRPIIENIITQTRNDIGIACFGTAADSDVLWQRYGGDGAGVCVEFEVPDALLGTQLHRVVYDDARRLHIDDFLRARNDRRYAANAYATLLTKSTAWESEAEVRFLSQRQNVEVVLDGSHVSRVIFGARLDADVQTQIRRALPSIEIVANPLTA